MILTRAHLGLQKPEPIIVGYFTVTDNYPLQNESFETAAWYRTHKVKPGRYPVTLHARRTFEPCAEPGHELVEWDVTLAAEAPTTVVGAYLGTLWGGMPIGPDKVGPRAVGTESSRRLCIAHGWHLADLNEKLAQGLPDGFEFVPDFPNR